MTALTASPPVAAPPGGRGHAVPSYARGKPYSGRHPIIARDGWGMVALFVIGTLVLGAGAWWLHPIAGAVVGVVGLLLTLWCLWFFRDPERAVPSEPGAIICPADGVLIKVEPGVPPAELGLAPEQTHGMTKLSIFMNVFNVHVNRSPAKARVARIAYHPGAFFNASFDKSSELNERCSHALELDDGRTIAMVQIAGLVARRIVVKVDEGSTLRAGERYGLIRFGSRVDLYVPEGFVLRATLGDKTVAGSTVLGTLPGAGGAA
ncbi:MAG: phosphatidylserine decarboxylase family protein [Phycisphaerales bacterium]